MLRDALRMSIREFASHCGLGVSSIAAIEARGSGAKLRPSTQRILDQVLAQAPEPTRERFRQGLSDMLTGMMSDDALTDRRTVMKLLASGLGAAATVPHLTGPASTPTASLGATEYLDASETLASMYRSTDPQAVWPVAAAFADELLDWYTAQVEPTKDVTAMVVSVQCQVGLWACHSHQPARAYRYLATAYEVAASGTDRGLEARALGALSYFHSSAPRGGRGGNPRRTLELLERALALAAHADAFTRGWLATWRADQHATLGDVSAAWRDIELADRALAVGDDGPERGFFARRHYGYGMREHLDSVRALVHSLAGEQDEAEAVFSSVQARAANNRRRVASFAHQALGYAASGTAEAACDALVRSVELGLADPYPMGLKRVVGVRAAFPAGWEGAECVRQLDSRIARLPRLGS